MDTLEVVPDSQPAQREAIKLRLQGLNTEFRNRFPIWTVYRPHNVDHAGKWVARLRLALPQEEATGHFVVADNLIDLRAVLPPQLENIGRSPTDDDVIEESYI